MIPKRTISSFSISIKISQGKVIKYPTVNASKKGTQVIYITGNHDDFLRHYSPIALGTRIKIVNDYVWKGYYITHGDLYDGIVSMKWLGILGSIGYEMAIGIDHFLKKLGHKKSLSKYLKNKVKNAVKFITDFENQLVYQAKERGCKGVIAGHIHTPADKIIKDIHYLNCGDWIENNSYIIYDNEKFELKQLN